MTMLTELTGMRLLLLHRDRLDPDARRRWEGSLASGACVRVVEVGSDVVCELPAPPVDRRARLVAINDRVPERTFGDVPLTPLGPGARHASLAVRAAGGAVLAGLASRVRLEVTNRGDEAWPGLAPLVAGVTAIRHRWRAAGEAAPAAWQRTPLLCDLAPGESCDVVVPVLAPSAPGDYELELTVGQEGGAAFALEPGGPLSLAVRVAAPSRAPSLR
jgi:hypothetical protein